MILRAELDAGWVSRVAAEYRDGRPLALLFDYDGTLTPIVRHPSLARLPAANRDRLTRLAALPDVAVGVISGRALAEVQAFVGVTELYYAGSGGLELDLAGGRVEYPGAESFRRVAAEIEVALGPILARFPGTWIERKPVALAVHYRGLAPAAAVRFRAETSTVLERYIETQHREVSEALEVTPAGGWDKGTAVELILDRHGPDVLPVYFGDAANDTEAMAVTELGGGMTIGVGPDAPSMATHRVASVAELEGWLDRLLRELSPACERKLSAAPRPLSTEREDMPTDLVPAAVVGVGTAPLPSSSPTGPGVLIVEPDPEVRADAGTAFRQLGWRVWEAADPDIAVRTMRDYPEDIHATLIDLQFPGFQGMRVMSDVLRYNPNLVRFGMSADVPSYAVTAFRVMSDITLFSKPLDAGSVSATLRWLLGIDDHPEPPADCGP